MYAWNVNKQGYHNSKRWQTKEEETCDRAGKCDIFIRFREEYYLEVISPNDQRWQRY